MKCFQKYVTYFQTDKMVHRGASKNPLALYKKFQSNICFFYVKTLNNILAKKAL